MLAGLVMMLAVPYAAGWFTAGRSNAKTETAELSSTLFDVTMLCLLPLTLIYQQFGDEYLLVYVPWVIWMVSGRFPWRSRAATAALAALTVIQLVVVTLWVDGILSRNEVQWAAARNAVDRLHASPQRVSATWTWAAYYAFDDYLAHHPASGQLDFRSMFDEWVPAYRERAEYRVEIDEDGRPPDTDNRTLERRRLLSGGVVEARAARGR